MNYPQMRQTALNLLRTFGNPKKSILFHREENGDIKEYKGVAVKLRYDEETIGLNANVIKAGDAKVLCLFDVMPTETVDIIQIENEKFSIIKAGDLSPDNITKILFTLQVRKN